jgi:peptidoglycan/LPS O-acetylase OafA/YrhL
MQMETLAPLSLAIESGTATDSTGHVANNFDFVRFVAASAVLYSHCFALTAFGGYEPLGQWTHGEFVFGGLAVRVFFVISGFLVTASWLRNPRILAFSSARCLRIFPALAVALAYCVLLGALTTSLPTKEFLTDPNTFAFYWHNLILRTEFRLPGVFLNNPVPDAVNGSLWSLYYEFRAYLVVLGLGALGFMSRRWLGALAWLAAALLIFVYRGFWGINVDHDWPVINANLCFVGGALIAMDRRLLSRLGATALIAGVMLPFALGTPLSNVAMDLFLISATLWFAHLQIPVLSRFGRRGDFSYGMFIYAFPTQQLIAWFGVTSSPYAMLPMAYAATLALAVFSWHWVERPCRDIKRYFRGAKRPVATVAVTSATSP